MVRGLRDRWLEAAHVNRVVDDPSHPAWFKLGAFLHEQLEGKSKFKDDLGERPMTLEDLVTLSHVVEADD